MIKDFFKTLKPKTIIIFVIELAVLIGVISFIIISDKSVKKDSSLNTYSVSFDSDGGTKIESQMVTANGLAEKPNDPVKEGYYFIAWYDEDEAYNFNTRVNKNIKLEAKWEKMLENSYIVKFDSDEGSTVENQIVTEGHSAQRPEDPVKKGAKFIGWYLNDVLYDFSTPVVGGISLLAKWETANTVKTTTKPKPATTIYLPQTDSYHVAIIFDIHVNYNLDGTVSFSNYKYSNNGNSYYVDSVDGYEIYRSTSSSENFINIATTKSVNHSMSGLDTSRGYYYKCRAYKTIGGTKIYGDFGSATFVPGRFAAPVNVMFQESPSKIQATFNPVADANSYEIYSDGTKIGSSASTSITINRSDSAKNYKIVAVKTSNSYVVYGNLSSDYFIPAKLSMPVKNNNSQFSWDSSSDATKYLVKEYSDNNCKSIIIDSSGYTQREVSSFVTGTIYNPSKNPGSVGISKYTEGSYYKLISDELCITKQ